MALCLCGRNEWCEVCSGGRPSTIVRTPPFSQQNSETGPEPETEGYEDDGTYPEPGDEDEGVDYVVCSCPQRSMEYVDTDYTEIEWTLVHRAILRLQGMVEMIPGSEGHILETQVNTIYDLLFEG